MVKVNKHALTAWPESATSFWHNALVSCVLAALFPCLAGMTLLTACTQHANQGTAVARCCNAGVQDAAHSECLPSSLRIRWQHQISVRNMCLSLGRTTRGRCKDVIAEWPWNFLSGTTCIAHRRSHVNDRSNTCSLGIRCKSQT